MSAPVRAVSRLVAGAVLVLAVVVGSTPVAGADPAGPTDFRSEVVAVDPVVPGLEVQVIGGDAFLQLSAPDGVEVLVVGYHDEPYLRFEPDGTVLENRRSPTTYLNEDRFADATPPADASADADPVWREVAGGGRYAWHDHRIHWMLPEPPSGRSPGEQILDGAVPLVVDGRPVEVQVVSTLAAPPSWWPAVAAAASALAVVAVARAALGPIGAAAASVAAGGAAVAVAATAHWSVPPETGPSITPLALPVVALVLGLAALVLTRWRAALVLAAGAELALWAVLRRDVLDAAILPTDAPFWLDRAVTAGAGAAGVALVVLAVGDGALGPLRSARPSSAGNPPPRPATGQG